MPANNTRALYIGRFQPPHLGHLHSIQYILGRHQELVVVIGSAQYSHTARNPFTAGERITMLKRALHEANLNAENYYLIPVRDLHIHKTWVAHVVSQVPEFQVVYSNEPLTSTLFREAGIRVEPIPFHERETHSSTEVRKRMLNDDSWRELVPSSVAAYVDQIGGVERIRNLAKTDNPNNAKG